MPEATHPRTAPAFARTAPPAPSVPAEPSEPAGLVRSKVLADPEFQKFGPADLPFLTAPGLHDYLFGDDNVEPDEVFRALRWGGQFVRVSRRAGRAADLPDRFARRGFQIVRPPGVVRKGWFGLNLPLLSRKAYYFVARKVALTLPKEISERFTYSVRLTLEVPRPPITSRKRRAAGTSCSRKSPASSASPPACGTSSPTPPKN